MNNLVYPHDIVTDKVYYNPGEDSVKIFTTIENPNSNQISALAYIKTTAGVLIDSINLSPITQRKGSEEWFGNISTPQIEDFYDISVTAFDQTASTSFTLPNAARFTTAGPVLLDSIAYADGFGNSFNITPFIFNQGINKTVTNASIKLFCNDPWVASLIPAVRSLPDILPGEIVSSSSFNVVFIDSIFPGYFNFKVDLFSDNWQYWSDSLQVIVTKVEDKDIKQLTFSLEQNYPNPFNPVTRIQYAISGRQFVSLKVYDVLGNEIETLVNEEKPAGTYEITWNAEQLPSGVYFYQLKAGSFVGTKKMILIK